VAISSTTIRRNSVQRGWRGWGMQLFVRGNAAAKQSTRERPSSTMRRNTCKMEGEERCDRVQHPRHSTLRSQGGCFMRLHTHVRHLQALPPSPHPTRLAVTPLWYPPPTPPGQKQTPPRSRAVSIQRHTPTRSEIRSKAIRGVV